MTSAVRLSVVIANQGSASELLRSVQAYAAQASDGVDEIIVASSGREHVAPMLQPALPSVLIIQCRVDTLVPDLWAAGVARSTGAVIALATAEMVPETGWASAMLARYAEGAWAAVGGPILPAERLRAGDEAIYWLRYHRFATLGPASAVADVAGDNASYRREALEPFLEVIERDGFWENELNRQLVAAGRTLCLDPAAAVRYTGGESFVVFARQRVEHGRRFGLERFQRTAGARRWLLIAVWPLTPVALLSRVLRGGLHAGAGSRLPRALPYVVGLVACWSTGELIGYLAAATRNGARQPLADAARTN